MRAGHEPRGHDVRRARPFGNLVAVIRDARDRPANPRSIQREPHFLARSARRDRRLERADGAQHAPPERAEADAIDRACAPDEVDGRGGELDVIHLQLDDDPHIAISAEDVRQRRHVRARELGGRSFGDGPAERRRPVERAIVMDHHLAVARQVDIELDTVGAEPQSVVERLDRVLGRERAPAAMREHQGTRRCEERMHGGRWSLVVGQSSSDRIDCYGGHPNPR